MESTKVLVVGAGPTGLTTAAALTARGVHTTLVDAQPEGANTSRAAAVAARTLEVLEEIDVSERLVSNGIQARNFSIRDHGRVLIPLDFRGLPTNYPYTLMISQADTERLLGERLEELGGHVVRPKKLIAVRQDVDGAVASFDDGSKIQDIRARYIVGADGMHSVVRTAAGIGFRGHAYPESFALADVTLTGDVPVGEILLCYARAGLLVVAPLPGGIYRIVAPVHDAPAQPSRAFVQQLLDSRGLGPGRLVVEDVRWGSHFRIHHRVADTYRSGRLVLAGDAAHVHSPAGGQGMNLGIQDAVALAGVLDRVVGGESDELLDTYSEARRSIAQQVLRLTDRLTRLATLPAALRGARNTAMTLASHVPAVPRGLTWQLSGLVYR
jgi:2-polyprenyl-6-methoxyphenol hydroxylase-like FAD-dependent oxidoreductase